MTWTDEDQRAYDDAYRHEVGGDYHHSLTAAKWATEREREFSTQRALAYEGNLSRIRREIEPVIAQCVAVAFRALAERAGWNAVILSAQRTDLSANRRPRGEGR